MHCVLKLVRYTVPVKEVAVLPVVNVPIVLHFGGLWRHVLSSQDTALNQFLVGQIHLEILEAAVGEEVCKVADIAVESLTFEVGWRGGGLPFWSGGQRVIGLRGEGLSLRVVFSSY